MSELKIIVPAGMFGANTYDDLLCAVLRQVAVKYAPTDKTGWSDPGKYGCDFENDVFLMHPECWCDKDDGSCLWCIHGDNPNFIPLLHARFGTTKDGYYDKVRQYFDPPNFWFKPRNLRIRWYKYIGRDMVSNRDFDTAEILDIANQLLGRGLDEIAAEHARDSQERADAIERCFNAVFGEQGDN